jgi:hypothetical protein
MPTAFEIAFYKLCKSYPRGTVTVLAEKLDDNSLDSTGQTIGFRLDTWTQSKSTREVLYNPVVQFGVNIAGAVVMIFNPASAPFVYPAVALYNLVPIAAEMKERHAAGQLTPLRAAAGIVDIGLTVLPVLSLARAGRFGGKSLFFIEGVELAGELFVMTAEGLAALESVRDGAVLGVAELAGEVERRESQNPSDPELPRLKNELADAISTARSRAQSVILAQARAQAIGWASQAAALKVARKIKDRLDRRGAAGAQGGEPAPPNRGDAIPPTAPDRTRTESPDVATSERSADSPDAGRSDAIPPAAREPAPSRSPDVEAPGTGEPVGVRPGAPHDERARALAHSGGTMSTTEAFTTGPVPGGDAIWDFVGDPANWTPERAALHQRLVDAALADARVFAESTEPGQLFAMRGNTGAGKSRATRDVDAMKAGNQAAGELRHRNVNPDNFKVDLAANTDAPVTSSQTHVESSMLARELLQRLAGMTNDAGGPASFVVDKRLGTVRDVAKLADMARNTGRTLKLYDVDAPLELSLVGVLMRAPGGDSPIPPFNVIGAEGLRPARNNREQVMQMFVDNPSLGTYELFGTEPSGTKVPVATVVDGRLTVYNEPMLQRLTADPAARIAEIKRTVIDESFIDEFTDPLPGDFAAGVRKALTPHLGRTFEEAIEVHSETTPNGGSGD